MCLYEICNRNRQHRFEISGASCSLDRVTISPQIFCIINDVISAMGIKHCKQFPTNYVSQSVTNIVCIVNTISCRFVCTK